MKFFCMFIGTLAVGSLVMYWPVIVMGVVVVIALIAAALERKPVQPESDEQYQTEAAAQSDFLKAA